MNTYFEDLQGVLRCMEAFHKDPAQPEMKRYAKALMQLLDVMRAIQDVAFDQTEHNVLDRFDYVDVKDWLLSDWLRVFPKTDPATWKTLNTCDYSTWGYSSPEAYWEKIQHFCSSGEEVERRG